MDFAFLRRLLDGSQAADVPDGREFDGGLMALARMIVQANLSRSDLTPEFTPRQKQVSRASLYRLFEPEAGMMHVVQGERLNAVRDALADPMQTRTLGRLAARYLPSAAFRNSAAASASATASHPRRGERRAVRRIAGQSTMQHVWKWLRET